MKWRETIASECRYGENAEEIFGNANILWEDSESDYQGHATVIAEMPDGSFIFYEWWYGSCSGCDTWEAEGLSDAQIVERMKSEMVTFKDIETLRRFLCGCPEDDYSASGEFDTGGLAGIIDLLGGGALRRLEEAWVIVDNIMKERNQ